MKIKETMQAIQQLQEARRNKIRRKKYYQVVGKLKYIPVSVYLEAKSSKDAEIDFYAIHGTEVTYILQITKKNFDMAQQKIRA